MKKLTFTFKEDDTVSVDAVGYKGPTCTKDTDKLLATLNAQLDKRDIKKEFYAHEKTENRASIQG